jgi:hypothetical protein
VTDNCGVTLTPAGPVETGSVVCEGDYTYTWTYTDCEGNSRITFIPSHRICTITGYTPTSDVVDCYANIVLPAPPVMTDNCGVT